MKYRIFILSSNVTGFQENWMRWIKRSLVTCSWQIWSNPKDWIEVVYGVFLSFLIVSCLKKKSRPLINPENLEILYPESVSFLYLCYSRKKYNQVKKLIIFWFSLRELTQKVESRLPNRLTRCRFFRYLREDREYQFWLHSKDSTSKPINLISYLVS